MRDFNEVRMEQKRYGLVFNVQGTNAFNSFISLASLIDLPLDGYAYTWAHKIANKMSKLDRLLVSKGLLASFSYLSAICLDRNLLDHRPILMQELKDTWKSLAIVDSNELNDINSIDSLEAAQKSKVIWAIECDENTKFLHGILNSKRSQIAIRVGCEKYQQVDLEQNVSNEEIKSAVWDCGTNKSSSPDGFTFEFFCRYWKLLEHDIVTAVKEFFASCTFPPGCNFSFIALIPKIHDAKVVKDYCHISLIRRLYKIIAKILANRLSFVISGLISDVQSAFVSNRQIPDSPFSLNELLLWCKHKKFKAMVFKVDFENAFDSKRWDYLQDILKMFGFGDKWCGWINGCLNSAMGLVLVNGSPTSEIQFHKGLKQGDPLAPNLFILIMESLHLSFSKVTNAGLFSGIPIDSSMTLSHLFFADDVIFFGKWDYLNIRTIVNVLKCFHLASDLKINFHKSKLMGIGTRPEEVDAAATIMGCSIFTTPFVHLGVKKKVLASKKYGGLGVSSFYALNRALLFKWLWRFLYHASCLWTRFIKVIYGEDGALNSPSSLSKRSPWLDIIRELTILHTKGINLLDLIREKVGNGLNTLFCKDLWLDDLALKNKFLRLYALDNYKQITVVEKINHASMVYTFCRPPKGGAKEEQLGFFIPHRWSNVDKYPQPSGLTLEATCTDVSKITRKQSKTGKHGHGNQKSTTDTRIRRVQKEAKDSKLQSKEKSSSQSNSVRKVKS
ncbi:RNA-directed DNA polymerase, eukaryota [Tanacetum coccineum]